MDLHPTATPHVSEPLGADDRPIDVDRLADGLQVDVIEREAVLRRVASRLFDAEPRAPVPLRIGEVRALEATEWWIDEPSEAQRAELDRLLAAEDPILDALEAAPPG